ncbi:MAG: tetratricopeptide repeat protein [Candidatus Nitrosocosmicus sp.]
MDRNYINHISNDKDESDNSDDIKDYKDIYQNNSLKKKNLNIDENHFTNLDPKFKNSIGDFIGVLNDHLNDVNISKEQKQLLEKQIEEMTLVLKKISTSVEDNIPDSSENPEILPPSTINEPSNDSIPTFSGSIDPQYGQQRQQHEYRSINKPIEPDLKNAVDYYNKGISLYYLGSYNEAIACYDKAIELNPDYTDAYYNKGLLLNHLGDHNQAIACYDKAIELDPQFSWPYYNKGIILTAYGYNNEAIACYDKAIELNPYNADAYNNKGLSLYYLGSYNEAIACYDKAIDLNPQNTDAYYNKGLLLYYIEDNNEAIACYDKAIELNPQFSYSYYNKAQALSAVERYAEAIPFYDKAIDLNPQNADAYYNKAQALSAVERYAEALLSYDKTLELESENVEALYKKAWIILNHFPSRMKEASETIKKAIGLDPTNHEIMYTYGNTLYNLETYEEAVLVYEHIIKQKPTFSNVWYDCARSKIKLGNDNIESCISDLQKAIDLDPAYKEKARYEMDFKEIKDNPDFKRILGY